jgi:hypothetical protein
MQEILVDRREFVRQYDVQMMDDLFFAFHVPSGT